MSWRTSSLSKTLTPGVTRAMVLFVVPPYLVRLVEVEDAAQRLLHPSLLAELMKALSNLTCQCLACRGKEKVAEVEESELPF